MWSEVALSKVKVGIKGLIKARGNPREVKDRFIGWIRK
jgi:hypothetical protein